MIESSSISFVQDNRICSIDFRREDLSTTTTVLNFLRRTPDHTGTKEGCAEGDCGACTVVLGEPNDRGGIRYTAIDSCLVFLPMLHGKQLITVENMSNRIENENSLHPVQQAMVDCNGSQCGYCTPGFIMSLFALFKGEHAPSKEQIQDALTGNLCRCTGYRPIAEAAAHACSQRGDDHFSPNERQVSQWLLDIRKQNPSLCIRTYNQVYYKPASLKEALQLKSEHPDALLINGATDIALRVTKKHELLNLIIDLSAISELKQFEMNEREIIFGAGMSLEEIKSQTENSLPALNKMLVVFGSRQIRSLATIGGNLTSASPIGDTLPVLMAYDATIEVQNKVGRRTIPINEWILGYRKTQLKPDEILTSVRIPKPASGVIVKSYKVSKRKDLDISTLSGGFGLKINNGKIMEIVLAFGGMAATTMRASQTEKFLKGKSWNREEAERASTILYNEFTPISDARSGAEFRRLAARNLLIRFWADTVENQLFKT